MFIFRSDRNIFCRQPSDGQCRSPNLALHRSNTTPITHSEPANPVFPVHAASPNVAEILNSAHHLDSIEESVELQTSENLEETATSVVDEEEKEGEREGGSVGGEGSGEEGGGERGEAESAGEVGEGVREGGREVRGSGGPVTRVSSVDPVLSNTPAFKFLTRPDLYKFAKVTDPTPTLVSGLIPMFHSRRNGTRHSSATWLFWNWYR